MTLDGGFLQAHLNLGCVWVKRAGFNHFSCVFRPRSYSIPTSGPIVSLMCHIHNCTGISNTLKSCYRSSLLVTYIWTLMCVCVCVAAVCLCFVTTVHPGQVLEKLLLETEPFLSTQQRTWRNFCLWEKISASYRPGGDSENPFLASPWELSQRIMNLTASTHTGNLC